MKKVLLTLAFGLMTMVGFGQNLYPVKRDNITYFGMNYHPKALLNHIGVNYCPPGDRIIVTDSLAEMYMEFYRWDENRLQIRFDKHTQQNNDSSFMIVPDLNRIVMTGREFFEINKWYDEHSKDVNQIMGNMELIIGMKEWEIPKNIKPYKMSDEQVFYLDDFKSVIVTETYIPNKQVTTALYLKTNNGELIDWEFNFKMQEKFSKK